MRSKFVDVTSDIQNAKLDSRDQFVSTTERFFSSKISKLKGKKEWINLFLLNITFLSGTSWRHTKLLFKACAQRRVLNEFLHPKHNNQLNLNMFLEPDKRCHLLGFRAKVYLVSQSAVDVSLQSFLRYNRAT